jgi:hypothetical protein
MVNVQMMQLEMSKLRREIGEEFDIRVPQVGARVDDIVNRIDTTISEKFSTDESSFLGEQRRLTALVEEMRGALQAVDGANVERIGAEIKAQDGRDTVRTEFLHNMFRSEMNLVTRLIGELNGSRTNAEARLGELERTQHLGSSQGAGEEGGRGEKAQRIRVPDVPGWNIPTLKDGEDGFHDWRETFDNQVGSVWLQLDLILVALRDEKEEINKERFLELLESTPKFEKPMDAHAAD